MADEDVVPRHIGFIVDGNRRWAKQRGLSSYEGHLEGYQVIKTVLLETLARGVEYASIYVFSTENWKRSQEEVEGLMGMIVMALHSDIELLNEHNVRLRIIGAREGLSDEVVQAIDDAEAATKGNAKGQLLICFNYGGQQEIADAARRIAEQGVAPSDITPDLIEQHLYSPDVPACDMIVRTSGEHRLSNFMLWRSAYAELLFLDKLWPDMTTDDVSSILEEYTRRSRRFGG